MIAATTPEMALVPGCAAQHVLPPVPSPIPQPVERTMVMKAACKVADAQAELMRYLAHGPMGQSFAFEAEVTGMLAEALRLTLEVESARFALMETVGPLADVEVSTEAEQDTLRKLLVAIADFQKEWGRG